MSANYAPSSPAWLMHLGDIRWVRGHISTVFIGAVLLVCADLLIGSGDQWSYTAIGIWIMLLLVHIVIVLIARLTMVLAADDEDEVVLLPIKDAFIIPPNDEAPASWSAQPTSTDESEPEVVNNDPVSWTVATDMAQAKRNQNKDQSE